jgi:hypothetical protein
MANDFLRRIRELFGSKDQSGLELVIAANAVAATAVVALGWLQFGLTLPWIAVLVPTVFALLTTCLLFRHTIWIAACLGSIAIATMPALLLASAMEHVPYGRWLGGTLGAIAGLALGVWTYARIGRNAR